MKKEASMNKGKIPVWCKIVSIPIIICLIVMIVVNIKPTLRELRQEEIRPMFKRFIGQDLPSNIEDLRGIFYRWRGIEEIFIAFQADKEGCSYILDVFDGKDVKREEFPHEKCDPFRWGRGFLGCINQELIGMSLFDEKLISQITHDYLEYINTGRYPKDAVIGYYLESDASSTVRYEVLVFKERGIVYIFTVRDLAEKDRHGH